jgi:predicted metal-dependent enzyme (double-stranded beta helix superfamily)
MIEQLREAFASGELPEPASVQKIMGDYIQGGHDDWRQYALFCPVKYSRNLIEFNENFELIILCWLAGQESPIHNHSVRKHSPHPVSQFLFPLSGLCSIALPEYLR